MAHIRKTLLAGAGLAVLALGGCGGGGGGGAMVQPTPTPPAQRIEDQFGAGFGASFRVERNADPGDPLPADIEPLSLTSEPREIS